LRTPDFAVGFAGAGEALDSGDVGVYNANIGDEDYSVNI
jgi:hypothetical protein